MMWWLRHLLYDNPLFGRWLFRKRKEWRFHRNLGDVEYGLYGLNYRWQQQQRDRIVLDNDGAYRLISPRSRI